MPHPFGIVGIPKREFGGLYRPPRNAQIDFEHPLAQNLLYFYTAPLKVPFVGRISNITITSTVSDSLKNGEPVWSSVAGYWTSSSSTVAASAQQTLFARSYFNYGDTSNQGGIFSVRLSTSATRGGLEFLATPSKGIGYRTYNTSGSASTLASTSFTRTAYKTYSITGVFKDGNKWLYIDRSLNNTGSHDSLVSSWDLIRGCAIAGDPIYGGLSCFGIWNRALNASEVLSLHDQPYQFFWVLGRRTIFVPTGAGSQQLEAGVATATATAYDATLTPGAATITPDVAAATATAYDATLSSSVSLTADVAAATATAYDATLAASVSLTPDVATATATAYDATLTPGAATIAADVAAATATAYDATPVPGAVTRAADVAQATATAYDATLVPGVVSLTAGTATASAATYDATLTPGTVTLTPDPAAATAAAYDAGINGGQVLVSETATASGTAYNPAIQAGPITLEAGAALSTATANGATLSSTITVAAGVALGTATAYDATLLGGLLCETATATATAYDATLIPGATTIVMGLATAVATAYDAELSSRRYRVLTYLYGIQAGANSNPSVVTVASSPITPDAESEPAITF